VPFYDYRCQDCDNKFEQYNPIEHELPLCPDCNGKTKKLISNVNFITASNSPNRSLDSIIGADSERRWKGIYEKKAKRDKAKKEKPIVKKESKNANTGGAGVK